jgi:hypothetical protein
MDFCHPQIAQAKPPMPVSRCDGAENRDAGEGRFERSMNDGGEAWAWMIDIDHAR